MRRAVEKASGSKDRENAEGLQPGQEHLTLLRSSRHFKHRIRKEKFAPFTKLDNMLTKLYLAL